MTTVPDIQFHPTAREQRYSLNHLWGEGQYNELKGFIWLWVVSNVVVKGW